MSLICHCLHLPSLPEAAQEEDKPAAEEEEGADEEQGEGFQSGKHRPVFDWRVSSGCFNSRVGSEQQSI